MQVDIIAHAGLALQRSARRPSLPVLAASSERGLTWGDINGTSTYVARYGMSRGSKHAQHANAIQETTLRLLFVVNDENRTVLIGEGIGVFFCAQRSLSDVPLGRYSVLLRSYTLPPTGSLLSCVE